jgi:hypothetical protein
MASWSSSPPAYLKLVKNRRTCVGEGRRLQEEDFRFYKKCVLPELNAPSLKADSGFDRCPIMASMITAPTGYLLHSLK